MESTSIPMEINSEESLKKVLKMAVECIFINLELFMKEIGKMIKSLVKALSLIKTNKYIREDGLMVKNMVMECISMQMVISMMACG